MYREAVRSASLVVVVWDAGLVCREAVRSASLVVVVWSAGLVRREAVRSASLVVVVWSAGQVCRECVRSAMAWAWPLMLHGSASVFVLWSALARTRRASAYRSSSDSGGSGWMAKRCPWMLHMLRGSASVVVL